jgi:hypothetical protein
MNLLVAIQESLALAAHWLADEGRQVPQTLHAMAREAVPDLEQFSSELARKISGT